MKLEICANSLQSAMNAQSGGADRIELCIALELGGLTPSIGLISKVKQLSIPAHVLIRPRAGNFIYSPNEQDIIMEDIVHCRNTNVDGLVIGALTNENDPDVKLLQKCISEAGNIELTFHRAFDIMNRSQRNIEALIDLGFKRILTSGGAPTALEGIKEIAKLVNKYENRIEIMAGSGIDSQNVTDIIKQTGVRSVHSSARPVSNVKSNSLFPEESITDPKIVRILKNHMSTLTES